MGARDTALSVLTACRRQQSWADAALKQALARDGLDRRDSALAGAITYGVLQNRMLLDWHISRFLAGRKLSSLQPQVLDILRIAACQIYLMDKIPASAAVNEAVNQCRKKVNPAASRLVNGVLRNMLREQPVPEPPDAMTKYSCPEPLYRALSAAVPPEKLTSVLKAQNESPAAYLQVNTLKTDAEEALASLTGEGFSCAAHPWLENCLTVKGGSIDKSDAFRRGLVYVQDPAAKLAALCAGAEPGMRVLDCCSAPGGKSFAAAVAMRNRGEIVSCDIYPKKVQSVAGSAARLGLDCIHPVVADASEHRQEWENSFDAVIADVPCSGLGVIRKKPDIRYKDLGEAARLPELQLRILNNQASYVRPGGVLLYSTCTVLPAENGNVIDAFLETHPDFSEETLPLPAFMSAGCRFTFYPGDWDTDGFYIARLRRNL